MLATFNFFLIILRNLVKNFGKRGLTFSEVVSLIALIFVCVTIGFMFLKSIFSTFRK